MMSWNITCSAEHSPALESGNRQRQYFLDWTHRKFNPFPAKDYVLVMPVFLKTSLEESTTYPKTFLSINLSQSRKHEQFQLKQDIPWRPLSKREALLGMSYERAKDSERVKQKNLTDTRTLL